MLRLPMRHRYRTHAPMLSGASALLLLLPVARAIISGVEDGPAAPAWTAGTPLLEQEVATLKARVATSLTEEQRLTAINTELRHEVNGWVDVGKKVLKREAHIVDAIKQTGDGAVADQTFLRATVLADLSAPEPELKSQKSPSVLAETRSAVKAETQSAAKTEIQSAVKTETHAEHIPSQLISWQLLVVIFTVLVVGAFCWVRAPAKVSGLLSRQKHLQLSELQLEGASMGFGEGYLLVQPSGGLRTRTRLAGQKDGSSILRFDEVVTLSVQKGDGPCIFTAFRKGERQDLRIGTVSLQASELLNCVGNGAEAPCQYFRFNVQHEANSPERELRVAMRIRDLAGVPGAQKAGYRTKNLAHVL